MPYLTDPIGDFLTRMRNAQAARKTECLVPWSRIKEEICTLLVKEGWLAQSETLGEVPHQEIRLVFVQGKPPMELKRVSKPGRRAYVKIAELKPVLNGFGMAILTTSAGIMTDREAQVRKLGGELLCTIA
ncbi:30S ribosomal protein S8 [Candidatus Peribacteria bacterium RIFCSPHIGHO2_01_FULL_51_9]|nr:MAG: 30S ribosomal protein S8 [Candidatus Peribacteria bacterium RIFCSPHIGHO2_01_FULL_51_9]